MSGVIAALVSLGCVLVVFGLIARAAFGSSTILKLGGLVLLLAILPSIAVGLFGQMSAATPGGASGLGLFIGLAVISMIAFGAYRVWQAMAGGSSRGRQTAKVERKRLLRFDDDIDDV